MPITNNNKKILKLRCNWELSALIHFFGIYFCIVMLALIFNNNHKEVYLILFFIGLGINLALFIYSLFGYNRLIYLDNEKVFSGKKYEWRWNEVTQVDVFSIPFRIPMIIVKIITNKEYKKVFFNLSLPRYKKLLEI